MSYDFKIQYVNTKEFGNVDVMSRLIGNQTHGEDFVVAAIKTDDDMQFIFQDNFKLMPITQKMIRIATMNDSIFKKLSSISKTDGQPLPN